MCIAPGARGEKFSRARLARKIERHCPIYDLSVVTCAPCIHTRIGTCTCMHACKHGSLGGSRTLITQRAVGSMHYAVFRAFIIFLDLYDCKVTLVTSLALLFSLIAIFPRRSSADRITIPRNATHLSLSLSLSLSPSCAASSPRERSNKFFADRSLARCSAVRQVSN